MMQCEVIQDLLPLYVDDCCSMESRRLVEEHLKECEKCRELVQKMRQDMSIEEEETAGNLEEEKLLIQSKEVLKKEVKTGFMEKAVKIDIICNIGLIAVLLYGAIEMIGTGGYDYAMLDWSYGLDFRKSGLDWVCMGLLAIWVAFDIVFLKNNKKGREGVTAWGMAGLSILCKVAMVLLVGVVEIVILYMG